MRSTNMYVGGQQVGLIQVLCLVQMYKYAGVDTGVDSLRHFSREGFQDSEALPVPPEVSPIDAALQTLKSNSKLVSAGRPKQLGSM